MEKQESKRRFPAFPQPRRLLTITTYGIRILRARSKWMSLRHRWGHNLLPLLGRFRTSPDLESRRNRFAGLLLGRLGVGSATEEMRERLLSDVFDQLVGLAVSGKHPWIRCKEHQTNEAPQIAIQLVFPFLKVRRPLEVYRCSITGTLWPRSIAGLSPDGK